MSDVDLLREASDPNLPIARLRTLMLRPHHRAWENPSAALVLLTAPGQDLVAAAILMLRPESGRRYIYQHETLEMTMRSLAIHLGQWHGKPRSPRRDTARLLAGLFSIPWPAESP